MLDRIASLKFPEDFWCELEKSNAAKNRNAPVALILRAVYDYNGVFTNSPTQSLILQIGKTHRVAIQALDQGHLFGQKIKEVHLQTGRKISLLMVLAHGHPHHIQLGKGIVYQESDIHTEDFSYLTSDAKIFLLSCKTGQGLAQKIAQIAKRSIFAPMENSADTMTCLHNEEILSYDNEKMQHMRIFKPNQPSKVLSPAHLSDAAHNPSFSMMVDYVKQKASLGIAEAQCSLGLFYDYGIGGLQQSDEKAAYWYNLSANQGHALGQINLGIFYFQGLGGLKQSDKDAAHWYDLAAQQGRPEAQYRLGYLYETGRGVNRSYEKAMYWYNLAAEQGEAQALRRYKVCSLKSCITVTNVLWALAAVIVSLAKFYEIYHLVNPVKLPRTNSQLDRKHRYTLG